MSDSCLSFYHPTRIEENINKFVIAIESKEDLIRENKTKKFWHNIQLLQDFSNLKCENLINLNDEVALEFLQKRNCFQILDSLKPFDEKDKSSIYSAESIINNSALFDKSVALTSYSKFFFKAESCDTISGSGYDLIGISFYIMMNFEPISLAESIVHESVHSALFIEDMVQGVFAEQENLLLEDSMVISSIRREIRPFDLSFHAACVADTLLRFCHNRKPLTKNVNQTNLVTSLKEMRKTLDRQLSKEIDLLTENGQKIFMQLEKYWL